MIYIFFVLLLLFCSCEHNNKETIKTYSLNHELIMTDADIIGSPLDLIIKDTLLIVLDKTEEPFLLYDITKSKHIASLGSYGNGPKEFNSLHQITSLEEKMFVYDTNLSTLYSIDFGSVNRLNYNVNKIWKQDSLIHFYVLPYKNNQYISYGSYSDQMIKLLNKEGNVIHDYLEYPYKDEKEKAIKPHIRSLAYRGIVINKPDGTKSVQAMSYCNIVIVSSLENNHITKKEITKTYPEYKIEEDDFGYSVPISAYSPQCYIDVAATNEYIYLLYSGKTFAKDKHDSLHGNSIFVYDWELNPICKMLLDLPTYMISPTIENKSLYTISLNPDYKVVKYKLPPL